MFWDRFNARPRLILLLTAMLIAALSARCTLPIATNERYADAIQQLNRLLHGAHRAPPPTPGGHCAARRSVQRRAPTLRCT